MGLKVVICHSGRQHSHQLAEALYREGMLQKYWTGLPTHKSNSLFLPVACSRMWLPKNFSIPSEKVNFFPVTPVVNKLAHLFLLKKLRHYLNRNADAIFDLFVANKLKKSDFDILIAYENSALKSFQKAKKMGKVCVLDAASFHHGFQDKVYPYPESKETHKKITARKDSEIKLADIILTVSEFARQSYLDAGIDPAKVVSVPLGAEVSMFNFQPKRGEAEKFTFIFVGIVGFRKGVDLLMSAFEQVVEKYPFARLKIVGTNDGSCNIPQKNSISSLGQQTQSELVGHYHNSDCFILPSRHDSFGMVVPEAMATGLPAIVSDHVGAKEMIENDKNGWVFKAGSKENLFNAMCRAIEKRNVADKMAKLARESAENYTWERYRQGVVEVIRRIGSKV